MTANLKNAGTAINKIAVQTEPTESEPPIFPFFQPTSLPEQIPVHITRKLVI